MRHAILIAVLSIAASVSATPDAEASSFADIFEHYEVIRQVLIEDSTEGIASHATAIAEGAAALGRDFDADTAQVDAGDAAAVRGWMAEIETRARSVARSDGLEPIREAMAELTKPLVRWHELVEGPKPVVAYCPMVQKAWLQPDEPIGNPYAPSMLRCGEVVQR
jgi:Cu(I)/Ag(I) efflux system membrane fusion protein